MELPRRKPNDVYLPDGTFTRAVQRLRDSGLGRDLRVGIAYAFDFRTRMLPFWYADKRMAPCSVRTLGDVLHAAGFDHVRIVLQQWTPRFRPSCATLDGRPLDILLVSAMQAHAESAYDLIRDAHRLGAQRPLILAGGPKAIYEPTDYLEIGPRAGVGADCVVTGEVFVLLELLQTVLERRRPGESVRGAFERMRRSAALDAVPGLVYLSPKALPDRPFAVNTGLQRLLRDLDELPMPDAGYRLLEPPHHRRGLRPNPYPAHRVRRKSPIASLIATQGCRFNCSYCSIPAVMQRTWRHKSPERFVAEIKHLYEQFGIRTFFGTDDNFFNNRATVVALMTELLGAKTGGIPLGKRIRFYTEATQFDVYRHRDLLPMCRKGGLRGIWFGIEDLSAELVNKGQSADKTAEMFALLHKVGILPMAMMIHSDDQPLRSAPGDMSGLLNQARYVFDQGAVSYQCTYLGPIAGTREFEPAAKSRSIFRSVGHRPVPQAFQDGNHVSASCHPRPWARQLNLVWAYTSFYNPVNTLRTLFGFRRGSVSPKRVAFQIIGQIGLVFTIPRMLLWAHKLWRGPIEVLDGLQQARIPMVAADTGREMNWAIEHLPTLDLPTAPPSARLPRPAQPEAEPRLTPVPAGH